MIALCPDVGVDPAELAAAWDADEQAQTAGPASVETSGQGEFHRDGLTLVAIPVAVNLAGMAITALVTRLVARLRESRPDQPEVEVAQLTSADGDHVVLVRLRERALLTTGPAAAQAVVRVAEFNSLLLLAPFTAVIGTGPMLGRYRNLLLEHDAVRAGPVDLAAALDGAVSAGLAAPHPLLGHLIQVEPVLSYVLRRRLRHQPALEAAACRAHYLLHRERARELASMLHTPGDPQRRLAGQAATRAEYANLTTALDYGLRSGEPIDALIDSLDTYLRQSQQHETRRQLLDDAIAACPEPVGPDGQTELALLHEFAGGAARGQHRFDAAETHYRTAIRLLDAAGNRKRQSALHHQLGRIAHDRKQYDQAEASYCEALDIDLAYGDQSSTAITYHQLGVLAQDEKRYDQAEASYGKALDIFLAYGDQHNAASTYAQLGILAQDRKRYHQAETHYRKALDIHRVSDPEAGSSIAARLAAVLAELGQHREAARVLMQVAVTWHRETGQWAGEVLHGLRRERAVIGPGEFAGLVGAELSADLAADLIAAIEDPRGASERDGQLVIGPIFHR